MRSIIRLAAAGLTVCGTMVAFALPASAGTQAAASHCISVRGTGSRVILSQIFFRSGSVCFDVSSSNPGTPGGGGGSAINLFRLNRGVTWVQARKDFRDEFSSNPVTAAEGTRDLTRDVSSYGLADVVPGHPETVTVNLAQGTYYIWDLAKTAAGGPLPDQVPLYGIGGVPGDSLIGGVLGDSLSGGVPGDSLSGSVQVAATSADRFTAPATWPHSGTYLFHNVADTIHLMEIIPVKPGTTDEEIQAFFNSNSTAPPPFFAPGPSGGNDVVSPGNTIQVSYSLPRGTYVLMCFVADDMTGIPHAIMGMHEVIELR
jgi:hypothetical protein